MVVPIRDTLDCIRYFMKWYINQMIGIMMGSIAVFGIIYYMVTLLLAVNTRHYRNIVLA